MAWRLPVEASCLQWNWSVKLFRKKNAAKYLYFCSVLNRENDSDTAGDVNMQ